MRPLGDLTAVAFQKAAVRMAEALAQAPGLHPAPWILGLFSALRSSVADGDLQLDDGADLAYELGLTTSPFRCSSRLWCRLEAGVRRPSQRSPGPQANWGFRPVPP